MQGLSTNLPSCRAEVIQQSAAVETRSGFPPGLDSRTGENLTRQAFGLTQRFLSDVRTVVNECGEPVYWPSVGPFQNADRH